MRKTQVIQTVVAGLIAAGALACFAGAGGGLGGASAQSACQQWEVMAVVRDCEDTACSIPAGWEPFSNHTNFFDGIWLRRCAE